MAGLCAPLSTLRQYPHGYLRMTRGRCGSLLLHRDGLAPSTPCRSPGALRMTPNPEQVDIHHRVALALDREEMKAEVTIEQQHRQGRSQNREGRDNEKIRGERRPAEDG